MVVGVASAVEDERLEQQLATGEIQAGRRLVEQEELRASEQRPGQQHPLAFALAARRERALREIAASHAFEQIVRTPAIIASNVCTGTSADRLPVSTTSRAAKCKGMASAT